MADLPAVKGRLPDHQDVNTDLAVYLSGWLARPFKVNDVVVVWPAATVAILDRRGPWGPAEVAEIGSALAAALRPA